MKTAKKTALADRYSRNAIDRQAKPAGHITLGVEVKRCDECKRGEHEARWKGAGMGDYYCSLCQHTVSGRTKFCPECGAKMDEWEEAEG